LNDLVKKFIHNASVVGAKIMAVKNRTEALEQAVTLLTDKPPLESQMHNPGLKPPEENSMRIMAAPNLDDDSFSQLSDLCDAVGNIRLLRQGMREYPGGIDMGLTGVELGIADTGTLVLNSNGEETRLATMLCEVHVALLNISDIRETAFAMTDELSELTHQCGAYIAFITGASRTADIERVLAIGVHGPLVLHILLVEER
jgi:L-lactate dehydrogenase complex protein LldG